MKVTIYGAGYVGLVTAVCLAELGHEVCCVEVNQKKLALLHKKELPIYEPGLQVIFEKYLDAGRLFFTDDVVSAVMHGLIQMIAVGTPEKPDGSADLQYVDQVAHSIGTHMMDYRLIVNKSTVPPGTAHRVQSHIVTVLKQRKQKIDFSVASNPEFLREGKAISDFMTPDRIVVGVEEDKSLELLKKLYAPLIQQGRRFIDMDWYSAELTKYAANAFLATKISFINEMSQIAERCQADIDKIKQGIGADFRINPYFLDPGPGYGGACFPKDVSALIHTSKTQGYIPTLLQATHEVNLKQKQVLFQKIQHYFQSNLIGKVIAVWGLAFKPDTDDIRQSSSLVLIDALLENQCIVQAYDPMANENIAQHYGTQAGLLLKNTKEAVLEGADILVIVTDWEEFKNPDFNLIRQTLRFPVIMDGRNLYNPKQLRSLQFQYFALGRGDRLMSQPVCLV